MSAQPDKNKKSDKLINLSDSRKWLRASKSVDTNASEDRHRSDATAAESDCYNGVCHVTWKPKRPAA
jgi:hypothetical protein